METNYMEQGDDVYLSALSMTVSMLTCIDGWTG